MSMTASSIRRAAPDAARGGHIVVRGLRKHYGVLRVFDGVNLEVAEREIVALVGPSGCGKTTLLRCIDGLLPVDAGEIHVGDERVTEPIAGVAM
ncbi:MAG: ATP-binding cassette domain-containing protein, partial [Stellaceae bacterium]